MIRPNTKKFKVYATDSRGFEHCVCDNSRSIALKEVTERVVKEGDSIQLIVIKQYFPQIQMYIVVDVYYGGMDNES